MPKTPRPEDAEEVKADTTTAPETELDDVARRADILRRTLESIPTEARTPEMIQALTKQIMGTGSMATKSDNSRVDTDFLDSVRGAVVQVFNTTEMFDLEHPGKEGSVKRSSGTGVVISIKDRLILTDDHVAGSSTSLQVNRGTGTKKYDTRLVYTSEICDLALVTVDGEGADEFWGSAKELELVSEDVPIGTPVISVGYPMAGGTICMTEGKQSRIESHVYANSGIGLPISQITTPTNPGNSGGPGLTSDGKIAGITHQGMPGANNISHMIPVCVINKFLSAYRASIDQHHIFPTLHARLTSVKNEAFRESIGMTDEHDGLGAYVVEIAELSCLHGVLRQGDVLLGIDEYDLQTSLNLKPSRPDVPELKYSSNLFEYIHMREMGSTVNLKFLRDGEEHTAEITLNRAIQDLSSIQSRNNPPSFYINNGLIFMELNEEVASGLAPLMLMAPPEVRLRLQGYRSALDESPVMIIKMFDNSKEGGATFGYKQPPMNFLLVDYVNGEKVRNIAHVKEIMEREDDSRYHRIKSIEKLAPDIVVPRLSPEALQAKLTKFGYSKACSDDLLPAAKNLSTPTHTVETDDREREVIDETMSSRAPILYMQDALAKRKEGGSTPATKTPVIRSAKTLRM